MKRIVRYHEYKAVKSFLEEMTREAELVNCIVQVEQDTFKLEMVYPIHGVNALVVDFDPLKVDKIPVNCRQDIYCGRVGSYKPWNLLHNLVATVVVNEDNVVEFVYPTARGYVLLVDFPIFTQCGLSGTTWKDLPEDREFYIETIVNHTNRSAIDSLLMDLVELTESLEKRSV